MRNVDVQSTIQGNIMSISIEILYTPLHLCTDNYSTLNFMLFSSSLVSLVLCHTINGIANSVSLNSIPCSIP